MSRASRFIAAPVDEAQAARLAAHEDVLGDRAEGDEVDLLIDGADAADLRLRAACGSRPARPSKTIVPPSRR